MAKSERVILTEAVVYGATALGIDVVKEIATNALAKQPDMTLNQFINVLDTYTAKVKKSQTVKTVVPEDEPPSEKVIHL